MMQPEKAMVFASFAGDALALGAHWIYDTGIIRKDFGRVEFFIAPAPGSYHSTKTRGDFTHYGDQSLVLLRSIADAGGFDIHRFFTDWRSFFDRYDGYRDKATRISLQAFSAGRSPLEGGSGSDDLAGAVRIAPLVYLYRDDPDFLDSAAAAQTKMTHNDPSTVLCARFLAASTARILHGSSPVDALRAGANGPFAGTRVEDWVEAGIASRDTETVEAISRFGQTCHTPEAFPGVIHLIARYEKDLQEALIQSVMAGGDSAARNMGAGMLLGAWSGATALPSRWIEELKAGEEIASMLSKLDCGGSGK